LPDVIGSLTDLTYLCVLPPWGRLRGCGMPRTCALAALTTRLACTPLLRNSDIQMNVLYGTIPATLGNLRALVTFRVRACGTLAGA
jgi:hypothetical protein